jgi:hypothetical protein
MNLAVVDQVNPFLGTSLAPLYKHAERSPASSRGELRGGTPRVKFSLDTKIWRMDPLFRGFPYTRQPLAHACPAHFKGLELNYPPSF